MIFVRDVALWLLVSLHVVGAAFLFRRLFPRESPWLAFLLPPLLVVVITNFLEHAVPLNLRVLLPITSFAAIYCIAWTKSPWRVMRLPTFLFLAAFAFTLGVRMLRPNIGDCRDGVPDMSIVATFTFNQALPAEGSWLPPVKLLHYYCFEHYGASVLTRWLGLDIGTGFNFSCAVLAAFTYFTIGAVAWHLSRGKLWIVIAACVMTASATTGLSAYLFLTIPNLDPEALIDPHTQNGTGPGDNTPILGLANMDYYDTRELIPPGVGTWLGCLHSAQAGQLSICFLILAMAELLRRRHANAPWICLVLAPLLMLTTCTWGVPMCAFMFVATLFAAYRMKIRPRNPVFVAATSVALVALMEPLLVYFLNWAPLAAHLIWNPLHTEPTEFFTQWWPIYLPLLALVFAWPRLHPVTRIVLVMMPLAFTAIETWSFGERIDATGKTWGLIYAAGWAVFIPEVARRKSWPFRPLFVLLAVAGLITLGYWTSFYWRVCPLENIGHLDGLGPFRTDDKKARILETLVQLDNQVIIPGVSSYGYAESGLLNTFSHNRAYVTWSLMADSIMHSNALNEAHRRELDVNSIYQGKMADVLYYLRQREIAALVIYPDDNIDPAVVDGLKQSLAPYYTYEDATFRTDDDVHNGVSPRRPCAGVFIYRPGITTLLGPAQDKSLK
jgi:hypothetical protein